MVDKSFCYPITRAAGLGQRLVLAGDGWRVAPVVPQPGHPSLILMTAAVTGRVAGVQPLCLACCPDGRVRGLELPRLTESPMKLKNKLCCQGSRRDAGEMNNAAPASNL